MNSNIKNQLLLKNLSLALQKEFVEIRRLSVMTWTTIVQEVHNALYIAKRTSKVLKVKSFLDKECKIVSINGGHGKFSSLMGSVTCKMDNSITFKIGSGFSLDERKNPPAIETVVTFKYKEMTKYWKPRFPVFLRVYNE